VSKQNKANKNNYNQAGRLTPDVMARERSKMQNVGGERWRMRTHDEPPRPPRTDTLAREAPTARDEQESSRERSAPEE
jgi:hypothetical protein